MPGSDRMLRNSISGSCSPTVSSNLADRRGECRIVVQIDPAAAQCPSALLQRCGALI